MDAGDCSRNKKGSMENTARPRRELKVEEETEDEDEEAAGEKRQIWLLPELSQLTP